MKVLVTFLSCAALLCPAGRAIAKEPVEIAPSSPWNLSYDKEACRLVRSFGEIDGTIILSMAKYAPGTDMEIVFLGKSLAPNKDFFEYRFDPAERNEEAPNILYGAAENGSTMWQLSSGLIPQRELDAVRDEADANIRLRDLERRYAATSRAFVIAKGVKSPVSLRIGSLKKPLEAMHTCLDDLVTSWGFDPAVQNSLVSHPEPVSSPNKWIDYRDYPSEALRKDLAGAVHFRLSIDGAGGVSGCTIQSSYSDPSFPETVCKAFTREGRFEPARNAAGEPIASYYASTVIFKPN